MNITDLIGKPFVDGGRGPDEFDCWGLVKFIYQREMGINVPDYAISAFESDKINDTVQRDRKGWQEVEVVQPGDLMFFSMDYLDQSFINHVGMSVGTGSFIHVIRGHNVSVSKLRNHFWSMRYKGAVRWQA